MIIFDCETNGLLYEATTIHCIVTKDTTTGEVIRYYHEPQGTDKTIQEALDYLTQAQARGEVLVAHNGIKFDLPVFQKLYPEFTYDQTKVLDTLVMSRLIYSDIGTQDSKLISKNTDEFIRFPGKLWGSHSLKAWGWRLGVLKGTYAEDNEDAWDKFSMEMLEYCVQDVEVTQALLDRLLEKNYSQKAIDLEHQAAYFCGRMERSGWPFREADAGALYAKLSAEREAIRQEMAKTFEPQVIDRGLGKSGKPLKPKVVEFNPASRKQIAERLTEKYGWKPKEFTPGGEPKVDEDTLKKLPYPEAQLLAKFFLLEKRVGQLAEGDQGWLKLVRNGHIHHSINTNGAVTGRCTHAGPNIAQVPSVRAVWGPECRSLFTVRPGFRMVGADLSGLELRCLAHFMSRWDQGEYGEVVLNGDIHTKNQEAAGLPTRSDAKTFAYAFLYGAGDSKLGSIVGKGAAAGKKLREQFLAKTPALKKLKELVSQRVEENGYLIGLDGRHLAVRSEHAALNTLLQSAGALIAKKWVCILNEEIEARGYQYGWDKDWTMLQFVHDEVGLACREGLEEEFSKIAVESAAKAGEFFNFKCPIGAEAKVGMTWLDVH